MSTRRKAEEGRTQDKSRRGQTTGSARAQVAGEHRPWDRQPEESGRAFQAFAAYRDLGPERTLDKAAAAYGRHVSLMRRWSARYGWRVRAAAWDDEQAREMEAALRQRRRAACERQARDAEQLQRLGMARLASLIKRDPDTGELTLDEKVSAHDAMAAYKLGLDIQRALVRTPQRDEKEHHVAVKRR